MKEHYSFIHWMANTIRRFTKWLYTLRHIFVALFVLGNSGLIFHTIYGLPIDLFTLFNVRDYEQINTSFLTNAPYFMLGVFIVMSSVGLFFRARISWMISFTLMLINIFYTAHIHPQQTHNIHYGIASLVLLFMVRKYFSKSSVAAGSIFALISVITLLLTSTYGALYFGDGFNPKITSLLTAFYYAIETMSTVGYGDIVPVSEPARLFTISVIVSGITVFATSATSVLGPVVHSGFERLVKGNSKKMDRTNHFIICGLSSLAVNTIKQLTERKQPITVIVSPRIQQVAKDQLEGLDVVVGDYSDGSILTQAGVMNAKAVLALSDDDADNAFIVLSAIELASSARTVALVNESKNINKVKSVNPDIVISPQQFASDILARVLNGESIDSDSIVASLLHSVQGLSDKEINK
ncbi:voltage-gated potassium channel protein [Photobacterium kishitanii]|uniref:Voltage-gated potassium channel protein n=2 Tax=Photobacterium kishitanii TaxID=318456 RepID=A0A2T3KF03_9GAMM|nr:voltage-gated potassium channel protein [Photobacterium kishitanii]KJG09159.1 voltage-gated potassium channel [Photobacterium kishitanii]KJG56373.1 voltage-gated potassium channel [Photobacterium kishitanii]KJG60237.1 voltage-gated potassium channel [Photobacterium kishitanii]KJG64492.1 voltage-gated potassium channel [Photobacterium kishitanii]KJG68676.1 voltage-gated potassium channel [Photobacterium kishitanii]